MEIRLGQVFGEAEGKGTAIEFADVLNEKEFSEIEAAVAVLQELHTVRYLHGFVQGNEDSLLNYFQSKTDEWAQKIKDHIYLDFMDFNDCQLHANRLFLNYLSSMRTFIDHCETYLKRTFGGKQSNEFQEFKKMTNILYDASFGYAFFWGLRNYAQHCGLPIGSVKFNWKAEDPRPGSNTIHYEFRVMFDRDGLLKHYDDWKEKVKSGLMERPDEFDIVPLVYEVTSIIRTMEDNLEVILHDRFLEAARFIDSYASRIKREGGRVFVAYDIITNEQNKIENYSSVDLMEPTVKEVLAKVLPE